MEDWTGSKARNVGLVGCSVYRDPLIDGGEAECIAEIYTGGGYILSAGDHWDLINVASREGIVQCHRLLIYPR